MCQEKKPIEANKDNDLKYRKGLEDHFPSNTPSSQRPTITAPNGGVYEVGIDLAKGKDKSATTPLELFTE